MLFHLLKTPAGRLPFIRFGERGILLQEFDIHATVMLRLDDLTEENIPLAPDFALARAREELGEQFRRVFHQLQSAAPNHEHLILTIRTPLTCLSSLEPPTPIYDPPPEWDEELEMFVLAEGAQHVGETPARIGWYFFMILGMALTNEMPTEFAGETFEEPPFWHRDYVVPADVTDLFASQQGLAQIAAGMTACFKFGSPTEPPAETA